MSCGTSGIHHHHHHTTLYTAGTHRPMPQVLRLFFKNDYPCH